MMFFLNPLNIVYTIFFNFRFLPVKQALHLPIWITQNVRIKYLKRNQIVLKQIKLGLVKIGVEGSPGLFAPKAVLLAASGGKFIFDGAAIVAKGTVLRCDENAIIQMGDNFYCNCNCFFRSTNIISFGKNCSVGWNVTLNTSDGHSIWHEKDLQKKEGPITIGNHVWITPNVSFTKNSGVGDDCVVAQGAVVTKRFNDVHCLIGGVPARVVASNIEWKA